ncbi:EexN family lipoprotein (plasmid) [Caulobacter sp. ErkDOM-YI]|uniref:EexN family lipoprotein n=1 Tax=unclassified Caulobacter TaxID=2648921 RepID=UPI003AF43BBE
MCRILILVGLATLGLSACSRPVPSHDKAYFAAHPQERGRVLAACRNDPGRRGETPNCVNALQADADAEHERVFHGAPPTAPGVRNPDHL